MAKLGGQKGELSKLRASKQFLGKKGRWRKN